MKMQNCFIPLLVFLTSFGLFVTGLCPGVYWGDDGLLIAASVTLGLSHPPGHPAYMMANQPARFIPAGDIAFRFNLMASLWMSLALSLITAWFIRSNPGFRTIWFGLLGLLLFSISHIFTWHQTGRAETYSLHVLLLIVCIISVCSPKNGKGLILAAFFAALMLGNQLFLASLAGPGLLFGWLVAWLKGTNRLRIAIHSVLVFLLGLSIYLVPIIRSSKLPIVMWTILGTNSDKIEFITARTYQKSFFSLGSAANDFGDRFFSVIGVLTKTSGWLMPIVFICSVALSIAHFRRIRIELLVILFVMTGTMIGTAACSGFDVENWDFQGYLLPIIMLMPLIPAMHLQILNRSSPIVRCFFAIVFLSSGLIPITISSVGGGRSLQDRNEPSLLGCAHLDSVGPGGLCLTRSDVGYVMIYLKEIEKYRSDIDLVSRGFVQRNMGKNELAGRYPGLNWPATRTSIDYTGFTRELILENSGKSLCWELADDDEVISGLPSQATGSMIELFPAPVIFGGARVQFNRLIGAIDENRISGIFTDRQAVEQLSVLFYNRGTFLLNQEQIVEALPSFEKAVQLDPKQARIFNNYGVTLARLNRRGEAIQAFKQVLLLDPRHPGAAGNIEALTRLENP